MNEPKKVGLVVQCASGRSLKIFEGTRFIGLVSISDIEKAIKSKNFVATVIQWQGPAAEPPTLAGMKAADPSKLSLNLFEEKVTE